MASNAPRKAREGPTAAMHDEWTQGNRFELLPAAENYVPAMLSAIENAKHLILFEQYLMESGHHADLFVDALAKAARRGVPIYLLLDTYGTKGFTHRDRQRLIDAGAALRLFNPVTPGRLSKSLARDHRKLLLIDHRIAFTGGFCITDKFLYDWYDIAIKVEGPVVEDWAALFSRAWSVSRAWSAAMQYRHPRPLPVNRPTGSGESGNDASGMLGRVVHGEGRRYQEIRFSLQRRISAAQQRVWLYTPYFLPTFSLRRRLMAAARRGVDVRLLVAGPRHDHPSVRYTGQHFYRRLLRAGVRIYEYQPTFTHAKFCLVDDWSTIGSCNFDHWSLRWNLEANQEVISARFAREMRQLFEDNLARSREIDLVSWARRPKWQACRERVLGTANAWLTLLR
ncbi:phosphatidylserine/phosphatidylglycerophosphate/cardiolipin synthase-like enzyme [Modicisalibacter xianhensis]|uniref:Phosphatidylserine/phosphatidylglycerophosphate/ cardiolipin synthase-like enzyme n=2 Tax=Modicisalibacter xianhensis TaxID=442341 RepID=A0A4R8FWY4_9GAMM|nr:phosphatidylserine/phosphatidylglycerophosphate/cardiolipin synthase-like enzyme [Halomonas xianhensis]